MANGKKVFVNKTTGEIIWRHSRLGAWLYFKADGKKFGYKVSNKDILDADGILKVFGVVYGKSKN